MLPDVFRMAGCSFDRASFCTASLVVARTTRASLITQSIVGFVLQIATHHPQLKYLGTFFAAAGIYPNVPQTVAWNGNNIGGSTKRSVGIAMQVGFGNLGGVLSGFTYTYPDAPMYHRGHEVVIGLLTMSTVLCIGMSWWCARENRRRDRSDQDNGREGGGKGWSEEEMKTQKEMGDRAGFFRYTT
jgi:hypothetical protein